MYTGLGFTVAGRRITGPGMAAKRAIELARKTREYEAGLAPIPGIVLTEPGAPAPAAPGVQIAGMGMGTLLPLLIGGGLLVALLMRK